MDFPKSVTIDACETFLSKLAVNQAVDPLVLPVRTYRYAFGGLASAIQAANTWARYSAIRALALRDSISIDEIEDLVLRPHKFAAAMSAKSIEFTNRKPANTRQLVYSTAKTKIEQQATRKFGQQHGRLCWFAFVDHSSKGFDRNFYIENYGSKPEPRQPEQFKAVMQAMIEKSMSVSGGAKPLERDNLDHLGRLFYELFLNTHEHGTRGLSRSEWLKPGVRIIYSHGINLNEAGATGISQKQPILSAYLKSLDQKRSMGNQKRFVEIGIVDSGLGYCGRWLADHPSDGDKQDISVTEEYEIFKKCFTFRQTSTAKDNKGTGLPVVMDRLTKIDGFMRIRSGRLAVYRDFIESAYVSGGPCQFSDWVSGQIVDNTLTTMSPAEGVAISLLIPLESE